MRPSKAFGQTSRKRRDTAFARTLDIKGNRPVVIHALFCIVFRQPTTIDRSLDNQLNLAEPAIKVRLKKDVYAIRKIAVICLQDRHLLVMIADCSFGDSVRINSTFCECFICLFLSNSKHFFCRSTAHIFETFLYSFVSPLGTLNIGRNFRTPDVKPPQLLHHSNESTKLKT